MADRPRRLPGLTLPLPPAVTAEQYRAALEVLGLDPAIVRSITLSEHDLTIEASAPAYSGGALRYVVVKVTVEVLGDGEPDRPAPVSAQG